MPGIARRQMRRRAIVGGAVAAGAVAGARRNRAERKAIEQQTEYNEEVMDQTQEQHDAPAQQASAVDPTVEIKKYKDLLDQGILTQEEFDAKKKELLGL